MGYQPSCAQAVSAPVLRTSRLAISSMVFGILGWCALPLAGAVVAIVCGHLARGEMRRKPVGVLLKGDGMATAGLILGYGQLLLGVLAVALIYAVLFLSIGTFWR